MKHYKHNATANQKGGHYYNAPDYSIRPFIRAELPTLRSYGVICVPCAGNGAIIKIMNEFRLVAFYRDPYHTPARGSLI